MIGLHMHVQLNSKKKLSNGGKSGFPASLRLKINSSEQVIWSMKNSFNSNSVSNENFSFLEAQLFEFQQSSLGSVHQNICKLSYRHLTIPLFVGQVLK